jgi:hypothetical protein
MQSVSEVLQRRLRNQGLAAALFRRPEDVVRAFGAVQAQDYSGALWAIGQRIRNATEAVIEDAEIRRAIVRTWPLRGTLHFVAAADARWITRLTAPRIVARNAARWKREFDLDERVLGRAREILTQKLEGTRLTREQLYAALEARRIKTVRSRGLHLLIWLSLEGTLCLSGRVGKQQSFALLDDWIPRSRALDREAALAELARRYFTSHGPATLADFVWWSGLTVREAHVALDGARRDLAAEDVDGVTHWSADSRAVRAKTSTSPRVRLLPAYDEYTVAYKHRDGLLPPGKRMTSSGLLSPVVLVDGVVAGTWKRSRVRGRIRFSIRWLRRLSAPEKVALDSALRHYEEFVTP